MLSTAAAAAAEEGGEGGKHCWPRCGGGKGELSAAAAGRSNLKYLRICRSSSVLEIGAYCVSAMSFHLTCHLSLGRGGSKLSLSRSRTTTRQLGATQHGAVRRGAARIFFISTSRELVEFLFLPVDFFLFAAPLAVPRLPFKRLHLFN